MTGKELEPGLEPALPGPGGGGGDAVLLEEKLWPTLHLFLSREG